MTTTIQGTTAASGAHAADRAAGHARGSKHPFQAQLATLLDGDPAVEGDEATPDSKDPKAKSEEDAQGVKQEPSPNPVPIPTPIPVPIPIPIPVPIPIPIPIQNPTPIRNPTPNPDQGPSLVPNFAVAPPSTGKEPTVETNDVVNAKPRTDIAAAKQDPATPPSDTASVATPKAPIPATDLASAPATPTPTPAPNAAPIPNANPTPHASPRAPARPIAGGARPAATRFEPREVGRSATRSPHATSAALAARRVDEPTAPSGPTAPFVDAARSPIAEAALAPAAPTTAEVPKLTANQPLPAGAGVEAAIRGPADAEAGVRAAEAVGHKRALADTAHGQVHVPDLGRIEVTARAETAHVDVRVRAAEAHATHVIATNAHEMQAHVRVEVPNAAVHVDGRTDGRGQGFSQSSSSGAHARSGDREGSRDGRGASRDRPERAPAPSGEPPRRPGARRFVL